MTVQRAANDVAQHRLAKVDRTIRRRGANVFDVDRQHARILLDQHRDTTRTLGGLARAATSVFGDVGADDDRTTILGFERQVSERMLQCINAAEAGMLDFRDLAVPRQRRQALCLQRVVEHALDDDGAG